jgi:4-carboxymuconolactone decarboxylase
MSTTAPAERLGPLPIEQMSREQKEANADFINTRGIGFSGGPWQAFIRSPELMTHTQRMGEYLRYRCPISGKLSELAILLVAREWTQDYEFGAHRKHGLKAGISQATVDAITEGRRPEGLPQDEQVVWDFVTEIQRAKRVSDTTYARALEMFGEQGVVDLAGIVGYYSHLALVMNVTRIAPPEGEPRLPRFPE